MKINLGLFVTSLTAAAVKASTDPNAADMSAADEQTFFKEHASNNNMINGALASIAELKAEMAATKSETAATIAKLESKHAAEMATVKSETAAVKSETAAKDAKQDAIIASLKAHRHGVVPSNLRRRNQEMSMSMPATANIWYGGEGDEDPEENFFFGDWDDHKESCCDELKGRVSKLEDEVGGVTKCVDYQESYKIDDSSPSLPTCKIGLGVSQVAIQGNDRVATRTSMTGRVSVSTEAFDVDAQDSVTVKAMKTVTVDAHDIDLKSKNDIMAHAGNDIQIKADKDVHITADASSGSVGDVKIAGENVHVEADESVDVRAKEHVMVDAGHNVTVNAGDTLTVKADEDVKIAGQEIRVDAEASVYVSAKEHVMVNADDDVKIVGKNVDVNAKDDVKIVGGDSVYVVATNASIAMKAGDTVTVEANNDVIIDAAVDSSNTGNVKIEGVKYFPQKKEICWSDQTKEISVRLDPPPVDEDSTDWTEVTNTDIGDRGDAWYSTSDDETFIGSFNFGKIYVGNGPGDVVVDIVASTGSIYFAGNDFYFESNLTDTLGNNTAPFNGNDDDGGVEPKLTYVEGALVALAVELKPVGLLTPAIKPVPQAKVTLSSFQDVLNFDSDDAMAMFWQNNQTATHPAKYLFPDTEEGEYDIKVRIYLKAESELQSILDNDNDLLKLTSELKVMLGPHFISAAVIDAEHSQCAAPSQA